MLPRSLPQKLRQFLLLIPRPVLLGFGRRGASGFGLAVFSSPEKAEIHAAAVVVVQQQQQQQSSANRCSTCRKKVGLTGFRCRCGVTFCGIHRYPEKHSCTFDFKSMGREAIAKANPLVIAEKLEKIDRFYLGEWMVQIDRF